MTYNSSSHISTIKDVENFFHHIVAERKVNFHPDDRFDVYVNTETKEPTFTPEECTIYDRLMDEAFEVCEQNGLDIYLLGLNEMQLFMSA